MKRIVIIIAASLLASCGNKQKATPQNAEAKNENVVTLTSEQYKNAGIETGKISQQNISSLLKVNGKIDVPPQSMISISVPLGGYLKSTKLLPGTHVMKGEVLAVMEDAQYVQLQQDYLTAKAQLSLNESEYNRQKELNLSKATSDKIFEQVKANYLTQQILLKSLEQKLLLTGLNPARLSVNSISNSINIHSPITGFVSAVNVNIGKYVTPNDVLFELVNPEDIHLSLSVFEKDINKLSVGQKLFAYTNSNPAIKYPCEIILISKNLNDQGTVEIHCHFLQYDKALLPGMFMNAEIEITGNNATALPEEAIVRFEGKQYVFLVKNNTQLEMQEVQTGSSENGFTEIIITDNMANQVFVIKGAYNVLMTLKNKTEA